MTAQPHAAPQPARLANGQCVPLDRVPITSFGDFWQALTNQVAMSGRVSAMFGDRIDDACVRIYALLADDLQSRLGLIATDVRDDAFLSLTPECPQVHLFEREIAEEFGLVAEGHPWSKPVRFHRPDSPTIGVTDYFRVDGSGVHEVAVGPVHAGVIEPGHFRFQCDGERVMHLEISLGYQHRGIERALVAGPAKRTIHHIETLAGDTSVGHALAYSSVVESLGATRVPARAEVIRGIALELERLANHTGDLGALAGDVGYLPTASYCGRLRGDWLNMTALICGNRFGRGLIRPGGAAFDLDGALVGDLRKRLDAASNDMAGAVNLLWNSAGVTARFEDTGRLSRDTCEQLGLVGVAARACGVRRDVRQDHPLGIYRFALLPMSTWDSGDVFARAYVRWMEARQSIAFIREQLAALPGGERRATDSAAMRLAPASVAVALIEGWRGEICHVAITDDAGRFRRYKIVDPSFHNWTGLALALRGQQISDFPLCNKSFNLSYCGHDL